MRTSVTLLFAGAALLALAHAATPSSGQSEEATKSSAQAPHVVLLLVDDAGWANFGWHQSDMHTPAMNELLKDGVQLDRHYAFQFCSPTRSALMSGRLPIHVNQLNNAEWGWTAAPVDTRMNMLPERLRRQANYTTHQIGKWHLGLASRNFTPAARGFDTSFGFLSGSEYHYTQMKGAHVDLWATDKPGYGRNGTYSAFLYGNEAVRIINTHDTDRPMFMYLALQVTHSPEEAPDRFVDFYPQSWVQGRRRYAGMMAAADEVVHNVSQALKSRGMWDNTLMLVSSDNGGPSLVNGASFANNYPLRGSKGDDFEGGVRVAAFVTGGLVPEKMRGKTIEGYIHMCDWYATVLSMVGIDPHDDAAGVPGIDSLNMWPLLSGQTSDSPRSEIPIHFTNVTNGTFDGALISGDFKVVWGRQSGSGKWWGPQYPNSTTKIPMDDPGCPNGCLFNIRDDPSEYTDLSAKMPDVFKNLTNRLLELSHTVFQSDANGTEDQAGANNAAVNEYNGFWGPWIP